MHSLSDEVDTLEKITHVLQSKISNNDITIKDLTEMMDET